MPFETTAPKLGDSYNNLLFKLCQHYHTLVGTPESTPFLRDSNEILLSKIVRVLNATDSRRDDYENTLLFKWAKSAYVLNSAGGPPLRGDSDNTLLFKIAGSYNARCLSANSAPKRGDSDEVLLSKILRCTFVCPTL